MKRAILRTGRLVVGIVLIAAGIVAGFLPVIQGWVLILAGLTVMAPESRHARWLLEWVKQKLGIHSHKTSSGHGDAS